MSRTPISLDLVLDPEREPTYTEFLESRLAFIFATIHDIQLTEDEKIHRIEDLVEECVIAQRRVGS